MKKSTITLAIFSTVAVVLSMFSVANASINCNYYGYIARATNYTSGSYIYFRTSALANSYRYCYTTDAKLVDAANTALTNRSYVYIRGNTSATSCPSSGSVGTCTLIVVAP
jgi:hypothetical protein